MKISNTYYFGKQKPHTLIASVQNTKQKVKIIIAMMGHISRGL